MTRFYVRVEPGADSFRVDTAGSVPTVAVPAPAEQGRANAALTRELSRVLDAEVGIVGRHRSRRKELAVDLPKDVIEQRLAAADRDV